jgi:ElaB/YqjD/DUF883 family membrane-anchored ribosome-binding protein
MTKEEAETIFRNTVRPYKDRLELIKAEHESLKQQCSDALKERRKAYKEYKQTALEAREIYQRNIEC